MSSILDHPSHPCESSASGSGDGYIVEIRVGRESSRELYIGERRVTTEWTKFEPDMVPKGEGIPNGRSYVSAALQMSGLLDYATAEALRWWAVAVDQERYFDLETRLVRHELSWSWKAKPIEAVKTVEAYDLMHPLATPQREVVLSDLDLMNILEQRKHDHIKKQEYDKGAKWRDVQRALMVVTGINLETTQPE